MSALRALIASIKNVFAVERCQVCNVVLEDDEMFFCCRCRRDIPISWTVDSRDNRVLTRLRRKFETVFRADFEVHSALSIYQYIHGNPVAHLIHDFKYHGRYKLAIDFGREIGRKMLEINMKDDYDILIPVPIHPRRLAIRGYNQTEYIARGISEVTGLQVNTEILKRTVYAESQTKRDKIERIKNVENNFSLAVEPEMWQGVRLLLIDDVLTTGSTTYQCFKELNKIPDVRLGVATVAFVLSGK